MQGRQDEGRGSHEAAHIASAPPVATEGSGSCQQHDDRGLYHQSNGEGDASVGRQMQPFVWQPADDHCQQGHLDGHQGPACSQGQPESCDPAEIHFRSGVAFGFNPGCAHQGADLTCPDEPTGLARSLKKSRAGPRFLGPWPEQRESFPVFLAPWERKGESGISGGET